MTPERYQPGIGLRPGGERPDLEPLIQTMFRALYEAIAAHSRLGLNVVADTVHHDCYSRPLGILSSCARQLAGLPVTFVGVRCPIEVVLERRLATWGKGREDDGSISRPVQLFQREIHLPGIYDLEVDTSVLQPEDCARLIHEGLNNPIRPTAFERLANET
jgi:chloramphenicol 3-O phosphotransferase